MTRGQELSIDAANSVRGAKKPRKRQSKVGHDAATRRKALAKLCELMPHIGDSIVIEQHFRQPDMRGAAGWMALVSPLFVKSSELRGGRPRTSVTRVQLEA